jgi:hypothetical protein
MESRGSERPYERPWLYAGGHNQSRGPTQGDEQRERRIAGEKKCAMSERASERAAVN